MKTKKINRKHITPNSRSENSTDALLKASLISLFVTALISLLLMLVATGIAISLSDPLSLVEPIGYVSLYLSAFFGGFAASKINKHSPYLTSTFCGIGFVILTMIISFAIPHSLASGMNIPTRLCLHALSLATFPIGALAGVKGSKKSRPKRKKRK